MTETTSAPTVPTALGRIESTRANDNHNGGLLEHQGGGNRAGRETEKPEATIPPTGPVAVSYPGPLMASLITIAVLLAQFLVALDMVSLAQSLSDFALAIDPLMQILTEHHHDSDPHHLQRVP